MDGPEEEEEEGVPLRGGRKRTAKALTPLSQACPVCGKLISKRYIEQHADRCARSKFQGAEASAGRGKKPATAKKKPARRKPPAELPPVAPPTGGPILHDVLGLQPILPAPEAPSGPTTRRSVLTTTPTPYKPPPRKPASGSISARLWEDDEGNEGVQFRNIPSITCRALPESLVATVEAVEERMARLPLDAIAVTTARGAIDHKRSAELRRQIQEEEYQLELYRSASTSEAQEAAAKAADEPKPKKQRRPSRQANDAADDAPERRNLVMKVTVSESDVQCEKQQPEEGADAGRVLPPPQDQPPPKKVRKTTYKPATKASKRKAAATAAQAELEELVQQSLQSGRTAEDEDGSSSTSAAFGPHPSKTSPRSNDEDAAAETPGSDLMTNQHAKDFVERMCITHQLKPEVITDFIQSLKAYKQRQLSAEQVSVRIGLMLRQYPDLVADFERFLPLRPQSSSSSAAAAAAAPVAHLVSPQPSPRRGPSGRSHDPSKVWPWCLKPGPVGELRGPCQLDFSSRAPPPASASPKKEKTTPAKKEPSWKGELTDDEYDDHGGFSDSDEEHHPPDPPVEGVAARIQDEEGSCPELEIVDDPELTRRAIEARKPPSFTSTHRRKVDVAVDDALQDLAALNEDLAPQYRKDYEHMKALTYKVWARFKDDPYTFDAFAGLVLRTTTPPQAKVTHATLHSLFDNLRYLFQKDADDIVDELVRSASSRTLPALAA